MLEVFIGAFQPYDRDAIFFTNIGVNKLVVVARQWGVNFGDSKAVIKLDEIDHPSRYEVRDTLPHIRLWEDDVVSTYTLSYLPMFGS